ncbi:hypothetical protein HDU86_004630 [Geranomyces michiganensis]|nr:hypothetical protein HDU86_004630 [Geranomyces michiganensis]
MWVFGYGSLIWKVDFPYETRFPGYVRGYVRRFWQGSKDHRGTPANPGRVVTLIPQAEYRRSHAARDPHALKPTSNAAEAECWGVAYRIADADVDAVKAHLDHREKNGYECLEADVFHPSVTGPDGELVPVVKGALVYCATSANDSFLGPDAGIEAIAKQIAVTRGPSGWNSDFLAPDFPDPHLVALERAVRQHIELLNAADPPPVVPRVFPDFAAGDAEIHRVLEVNVAEIARLSAAAIIDWKATPPGLQPSALQKDTLDDDHQVSAKQAKLGQAERDLYAIQADIRKREAPLSMLQKMAEIQRDIDNKVKHIHRVTTRFLATYDIILHPSFQHEQMAKKRVKGPQSYTKAAFARVAHANHLKMLTNLLAAQGRQVIDVSEAFSTQACCSCGTLRRVGRRRTYKCRVCNKARHRDGNAACVIGQLAFMRVFAWLFGSTVQAVGDQGEGPAAQMK